jgi:hypothetical protein
LELAAGGKDGVGGRVEAEDVVGGISTRPASDLSGLDVIACAAGWFLSIIDSSRVS